MPAPLFSASDYQGALQALMPRGRIWPRDPDTVQTALLAGVAQSGARYDGALQSLLADAFPATAVGLLPEWEAALGLPDPCAGESPLLAQRQGHVVARLTDTGGQSVGHFVNFAAQLGFTVTTAEFGPARFGHACFGTPGYGPAWAFVWQIDAPQVTRAFAQYGDAAFGEPYSTSSNTVLECELRARSPAHTVLLFSYS